MEICHLSCYHASGLSCGTYSTGYLGSGVVVSGLHPDFLQGTTWWKYCILHGGLRMMHSDTYCADSKLYKKQGWESAALENVGLLCSCWEWITLISEAVEASQGLVHEWIRGNTNLTADWHYSSSDVETMLKWNLLSSFILSPTFPTQKTFEPMVMFSVYTIWH